MSEPLEAIASRMAAVAARVGALRGWRRAGVAFAAGSLSVLAMAPFFLAPVLLLTLPALVWLIDAAASITGTGTAAVSATSSESGKAPARMSAGAAGSPVWRAAASGWWFGFGYFLFGLFWIGEAFLVEAEKFAWLLPFAVTLLPAGLALFYAAAGALAVSLWQPGFARVIALASALGLAEGLRGHVFTGLPWNTLGYALTWPATLMQSAGLIGVYALSVLVVIVFAAPLVRLADAASSPSRGGARAGPGVAVSGFAAAMVILAGLWTYGTVRLSGDNGARMPAVTLRLVQPSVPQRDKWQPDKQREIFDLHVALSRSNAAGVRDDLKGITHLVWPEAAMPFLPLESPQALAEIGELLPDGVHLISGALRVEWPGGAPASNAVPRSGNEVPSPGADAAESPPERPTPEQLRRRRAYNSLMVFGSQGGLVAIYDKIHLVPFGEYLPFQSFLESIGLEQLTRIRGGFTTGRTPRPLLDVPGLPPLLGLVCYEAIFPGQVIQGGDRPGVIVNVTNDGWFGNTTGPRQHFHMARLRAVETGVPVVRVANNGISAVIDGFGAVIARIDLDQRGVVDAGLPATTAPPLYGWWGELIYIIYLVLSIGWLIRLSVDVRTRARR